MRKTKLTFLVCSTILLVATLYFWTLYIPPLSELEGANAMGQLIVFFPMALTYPLLFPLIWLLQISYFFKGRNHTVIDYLFLISSLPLPLAALIICYTIVKSFLLFCICLSILTIVMTITSFLIYRTDENQLMKDMR